MKKILPIAIALLLLMPLARAATFPDVELENENYAAIEYLVSIGTLEGYEDGTFLPDQTVNRAELMKILVAGQGIEPDAETHNNCYPDVTDDWYARYVCYATEEGWVSGYPDGTFQPGNTVNKVEAIKMLINGLEIDELLPETVEEELFGDTDISQWYAPYLYVAKSLNLLEETGDTFDPTGDMTRAGISENIFRALVSRWSEFATYSEEWRNGFLENEGMYELMDELGIYELDDNYDDLAIDMEAGNFFFNPDEIVVSPGQTVTITFTAVEGTHTFAIDEIGLEESLTTGGSVTFTAPQESGDYAFYCSIGSHRSLGMEGVLTVAS